MAPPLPRERYKEREMERWKEERERDRYRLVDRILGQPYEHKAGTDLLKERGLEYLRVAKRDARRGAG